MLDLSALLGFPFHSPRYITSHLRRLNLFWAKVRHVCVFMFTLDPVLTPRHPETSQKSVWPASRPSALWHHSPFDSGPTSKMSSSKYSLLIFLPLVLNDLLLPHIYLPLSSFTPCIPLFSSPIFPLTSHRMVMYFNHPSPTSVVLNVSMCPRDHEVQLESHVVVQQRISPFINKISVQCICNSTGPCVLSRNREIKYETCEIYMNTQLFILSAELLLCHKKDRK